MLTGEETFKIKIPWNITENRSKDGRTDRGTDGQTDRWRGRRTTGRTGRQIVSLDRWYMYCLLSKERKHMSTKLPELYLQSVSILRERVYYIDSIVGIISDTDISKCYLHFQKPHTLPPSTIKCNGSYISFRF